MTARTQPAANIIPTSLATSRQAKLISVAVKKKLSNPQGMREPPPEDHNWADHENRSSHLCLFFSNLTFLFKLGVSLHRAILAHHGAEGDDSGEFKT